ncbi:MAG: isochorismatase family protein, partial [Bacilli bacterium]|nr:isochorismatase family protein [Bacilli bacterium]
MNYLFIIDMQNDFLTGVLGNKECVETIPYVKQEIESGKYDAIIFTQDTHDETYLSTQEGKKLPVPHCIRGSEGWKIESSLLKTAQDSQKEIRIVEKDGFGSLE